MVLVAHVALQIDLVRRLHVEERFRLVLHRDLRDLERIDEFIGRELEARGSDFTGIGAILVLLHLHGVDLHDGEEPLLLHVEVERRLVAGVAVLVLLEPGEEIIGPVGSDDLVVEGANDAGFVALVV